MRTMTWVIAAGAAGWLLGACSSAGVRADPPPPTRSMTTVTTTTMTAAPAAPACARLLDALTALSQALPQLAVPDGTDRTDGAAPRADAVVAALPPDLHDDALVYVRSLTEGARKLGEQMRGHAGPSELAASDSILQAPEARRAGDRIDRYVAAGCP